MRLFLKVLALFSCSYRIGTVGASSCLYAHIYINNIINNTIQCCCIPDYYLKKAGPCVALDLGLLVKISGFAVAWTRLWRCTRFQLFVDRRCSGGIHAEVLIDGH